MGFQFRRQGSEDVAALRAELELLREENQRLRIERQRLAGAAQAAARLQTQVDQLQQATDEVDGAWDVVTNAHVLRQTLLSVIDDVERTTGLARHQLLEGTPPTELDRRRADRRRTPSRSDGESERAATGGDGHALTNGNAPTNGHRFLADPSGSTVAPRDRPGRRGTP